MGILTPLAVKIGATPWMPKLLPVIVAVDTRLQRWSRDRVSLLDLAGLPNLTLRVAGRKSGAVRETPLLCAPRGDEFVIAGSYFGGDKNPVWVLNLRAAERAEVIWHGNTIPVASQEVTGDERTALWDALLAVWPNYAVYEQRTTRHIPVFLLTPVAPAGR
ncbi:nitroreductase family deazaflavin-dependent oxidoreductase [Williamsia sterculiae]|uniref:Deazaflavin-dependent oxidoreductase, nitroreductase family n=1 Tax=Williamsia sterculiae TaxID=1344003 RepID=A0A1N7EP80_9NOCA|nr:nitroreductase family deazaflavin-dependent oxidoreductase [Williamsia sterculiae]SIR89913.1 deazaflavin-dependent oxidoreductase, nitroreductase family [Williamsia sterculiae]